jgi:PQQ-dependent catabolism-associated CXXCW motif protein
MGKPVEPRCVDYCIGDCRGGDMRRFELRKRKIEDGMMTRWLKSTILTSLVLAGLVGCKTVASNVGNEAWDWGVTEPTDFRSSQYHARTPTTARGTQTILTKDLVAKLKSGDKFLLIDVLGGEGHESIPGALWLPGAGVGYPVGDERHSQFAEKMHDLTDGDRTREIVVFCGGPQCWLSYNAARRLVLLGYQNIYWYRGGISSWRAAGLRMEKPTHIAWRSQRVPNL